MTFTTSLTDQSDVVGNVITHDHNDHFDKLLVEKIIYASPEVKIYTVKSVADQLTGKDVQFVKTSDNIANVPYNLVFYGGQHALIHVSIPEIENVSVMVKKTFYFPGDSFSKSGGVTVAILALPVGERWLKVGESIDFLMDVKPKSVFPTHNGLHIDIGEVIRNNFLSYVARNIGAKFQVLTVGIPVDI